MALYVLRHAEAAPKSPTGRDEDRELTPRGEREARFVAAWLADRHANEGAMRPVRVMSSPAARARRTAHIVGEALGLGVEVVESLGAEMPFSMVYEVAQRERESGVLLVGHNPNLERVVHLLAPGEAQRPMLTGDLRVIERDRIVAACRLAEG